MPAHYGIIPCRFGEAAPSLVGAPIQSFYGWVACEVIGGRLELNSHQNKAPLTLAFSYAEYQQHEHGAYNKLHEFARSWIGQADVVVVDLLFHHVNRPSRIDISLLSAVQEIAVSNTTSPRPVILLVATRPDNNSPLGRQLTAMAAAVSLRIVSLDGTNHGWEASDNFKKSIKVKYREASPEPIMGLRHKLVAKRGHFRSDNGSCLKMVFEGSGAEKEIVDLFTDQLDHLTKSDNQLVLYHSVSSSWLDAPIRTACEKLGISSFSIEEPSAWSQILESASDLVLVVPLIDSGETTSRLLRKIREYAPSMTVSVLSVLSTYGDKREFGDFSRRLAGEQIQVRYLLKVGEVRDVGDCQQCKQGRSITTREFAYDEIDTFHFWQMAVAWQPEPIDETPTGRLSANYLPNFTNIVEANGAWLAQKVHAVIAKELGAEWLAQDVLTNPVLVFCPDEPAARELAYYVGALNGFTTVEIPRTNLDLLSAAPNMSSPGIDVDQVWAARIKASDPSTRIILLEEYVRSGTTKQLMQRALDSLGRKATVHVALADFRAASKRTDDSLRTLALYDCPLSATS